MDDNQIACFQPYVFQCSTDLAFEQENVVVTSSGEVTALESLFFTQTMTTAPIVASSSDGSYNVSLTQTQTVSSPSFLDGLIDCTADVADNLNESDLVQVLCFGYGFNTNFDDMNEVSSDEFFQIYANRNGYVLTDGFLHGINKHKERFLSALSEVILILNEDFNSFRNSLRKDKGSDIDSSNMYDITFMDILCCNFTRRVYELRPKCVDILKDDFISPIIETIVKSEVTYASGNFVMTNKDMEKLFLYVVTTLERLIILEMVNCWNNFCSDEKLGGLISTAYEIYSIDYRDPISRASYCGKLVAPTVDCPAAFGFIMGVPVSFIAVSKIGSIVEEHHRKCFLLLKPIIRNGIMRIAHYSYDDYVKNFDDFRTTTLPAIIRLEFNRMMESDGRHINNFLNDLLVWGNIDLEVGLSALFKYISDRILKLVSKDANSICRSNIRSYCEQIRKSLSRKDYDKYVSDMKDKWGVSLHPKFEYNLSAIRRLFASNTRSIISRLCYRFSSHGVNSWKDVSPTLFPAIKEAVKENYEEKYNQIYRLLLETPVISDGVSVKLMECQICPIMDKIRARVTRDLRSFSRSLWCEVCNAKR